MSDLLPLVGPPRSKEEAQMVFPFRHSYWWMPRRALMATGLGMAILGMVGFFQEWEGTEAVVYMNTAKSWAVIGLGVGLLWIGEAWSSQWKRSVAGVCALSFLALGFVGVFLGANAPDNLGFTHINGSWEAAIWLGVGAWTAITVWWPRRFFDYEYASGTSSGTPFD